MVTLVRNELMQGRSNPFGKLKVLIKSNGSNMHKGACLSTVFYSISTK